MSRVQTTPEKQWQIVLKRPKKRQRGWDLPLVHALNARRPCSTTAPYS